MNDPVCTATREMRGELAVWHLRCGQRYAWVAEQGAQVLAYGREGQAPVVWLSEHAEYRAGVAVRGGVPVCWPWFGDLDRNPEAVRRDWQRAGAPAPAHGFARVQTWQASASGADAQGAWLQLRLPRNRDEPWPHAVEPEIRIHLGERLHIALSSRNAGDAPVALSQALHTYLAVSDVRQAEVHGLDGAPYVDTLRQWQRETQQGAIRFEGEVDRIYLRVPPRLDVADPPAGRRLCLHAEGSRSAVVWNPHVEKSRRLSQFAPDAWLGMLCVETANVLEDIVTLAPGASHTVALSLWEAPL